MITQCRLKKFVVDNRIDRDGDPCPVINIQIDMNFTEGLARELAGMVDGELVQLTLEPVQHKIGFGTAK